MARIVFNPGSTGFLIVPKGGRPDKEPRHGSNLPDNILVQSDFEFPGVASRMGWQPCSQCKNTDGTVDCDHRTATEMISSALHYLEAHEGERYEALEEYFT